MVHPDAPIGKLDTENLEVKKVGTPRKFDFEPKDHVQLGESLDIIDFDRGTKVSGPKFYYLKNEAPAFKNDKGYISKRFFHKFLKRSSCGYLEAKRQFKSARNWVEKNKYNFKMDLPRFIQDWNKRYED